MASKQEFIIVKRRKKRPSGAQTHHFLKPGLVHNKHDIQSCPDKTSIAQKISLCRKELRETHFYSDICCLLESKFPLLKVGTVVCYGIGQVGSCHIAQHQFGLLAEMFSPYQPLKILMYDPVLQEEEKMVITDCGCQIMSKNEQCKFRVEDRTLFYMPHCGMAMYNNLLWANWTAEHLGKIAIIGNSFNSYHEKLSSQQLLEEAPYIHKIHNGCLEYPLPNSYPDSTIFNDTSIHLFPSERLSIFPQTMWMMCPEPFSDPNDPEIITQDDRNQT